MFWEYSEILIMLHINGALVYLLFIHLIHFANSFSIKKI